MKLVNRCMFALAVLCAWPALAQQGGREAVFRCHDAQGKLHVGSAQPPECVARDTEVLSQRGNLIRMIEGEVTKAKRLAEEQQAALIQKEKESRALEDRVLIDTYLTVADIERLRDQRLDLLDTQIKITEQDVVSLKDRIERLRQQSARFKPYADKADAPPLPDHIAEELVNTLKNMATDQQSLTVKRAEQSTMTAKFANDIKRFKELKGIQ